MFNYFFLNLLRVIDNVLCNKKLFYSNSYLDFERARIERLKDDKYFRIAILSSGCHRSGARRRKSRKIEHEWLRILVQKCIIFLSFFIFLFLSLHLSRCSDSEISTKRSSLTAKMHAQRLGPTCWNVLYFFFSFFFYYFLFPLFFLRFIYDTPL